MRYLGFPISDKKLKMGVFRGTVEKMRKKITTMEREKIIIWGATDSNKLFA
jgi:hypothetical protein